MKNTITAFLLFATLLVKAAAITATGAVDTDWGNASNYTPASVPTGADDVTFQNNVGMAVAGGDSFTVNSVTFGNGNSITIAAGGSLTINSDFTASNGGILIVGGDLTINGNLTAGNNLQFIVTGTLTITGNVTLNNGTDLTVSGGGDVVIGGNFTGGNNTDLDVDGSLAVGGTISVTNPSTLTGTGTVSAGGGCTGDPDVCTDPQFLPVELLYFKGSESIKGVDLEWATSMEENFSFFEVQRTSTPQQSDSWSVVGNVPQKRGDFAVGIEYYEFLDPLPVLGNNYYRLNAVDRDGSEESHEIIMVRVKGSNRDFNIYPNPVKSANINLQLNFRPDESLTIKIHNLQGVLVWDGETSRIHTKIPIPSNMRGGIYSLQITSESGWSKVQRFLID